MCRKSVKIIYLPDLVEDTLGGGGVLVGLLEPPVHLDPLKLPSPLLPTTSMYMYTIYIYIYAANHLHLSPIRVPAGMPAEIHFELVVAGPGSTWYDL